MDNNETKQLISWEITIHSAAELHQPLVPIITFSQTLSKPCVCCEMACLTERAGYLAKGENLIPVNCHANTIRAHNVYIKNYIYLMCYVNVDLSSRIN